MAEKRLTERLAPFAPGARGNAVAALVAGKDDNERLAGLEELATAGAASAGLPALLESALVDLIRESPSVLPRLATLLAARREEPAARRVLDLLGRAAGSGAVRATALAALRGEADAPAPGSKFRTELEAIAARLPSSPLREKLAKVAHAGADPSPEIASRAFAAAYEAARATSDPTLVEAARVRLAPSLGALGLAAGFDPGADPSAFDVRAAPGASRGELGRPAVRTAAGSILVRGVVFVAEPAGPAPGSELAVAVRAALAAPHSPEAREEALLKLVLALIARLDGGALVPEATALAQEAAGGGDFLSILRRALDQLGA